MRNLIYAECECNEEGSTNDNACHQTTGVCTCKPGWHGYKCQQGKQKSVTHRMNICLSDHHQSVDIKIVLFFFSIFYALSEKFGLCRM